MDRLSPEELARIAELRNNASASSGADVFAPASPQSGDDVSAPTSPQNDASEASQFRVDEFDPEGLQTSADVFALDAPEPDEHEDLLTVLGEMFGLGVLSAANAQRISVAAQRTSPPSLARLSGIGSSGKHPGNAARDFRKLIGGDLIPPTYEFDVPAFDTKTRTKTLSRCKVLLPHQIFSWLHEEHQEIFNEFTDADILAGFWAETCSSQDPQMHAHPLLEEGRDWRRLAIPLSVYGDGARYTVRESVEFTAWTFMLARHASATTWATRYISAAWVKSCEDGKQTWEEIWRVLAWSFGVLWTGVHPTVDHRGDVFPRESWAGLRAGQQLTTQGHFAVIHRVCGDLAWFNQSLWIKQFAPAAARICPYCQADRHVHPFKVYTPTASWRETCLRPPQPPPSNHPLFSVKGVDLFTLALDPMHTLDLGVFQHALANVLFALSFDEEGRRWGPTPTERLAAIWRRIQEIYRRDQTATRFSNFDLSTICPEKHAPHSRFPHLKGKAAETRCLLPIVAEILKDDRCDLIRRPGGNNRDVLPLKLMQDCLDHFVRVSDLIDKAPTVPGRTYGLKVFEHMQYGLFYYHLLASLRFYKGQKRWNVVNKHHFAHHLAERAATCSPRLVWTYGYEDLVGRGIRAAHVCAKSNPRILLGNVFMEKYRSILCAAMPKTELRRVPASGSVAKKQRLSDS